MSITWLSLLQHHHFLEREFIGIQAIIKRKKPFLAAKQYAKNSNTKTIKTLCDEGYCYSSQNILINTSKWHHLTTKEHLSRQTLVQDTCEKRTLTRS